MRINIHTIFEENSSPGFQHPQKFWRSTQLQSKPRYRTGTSREVYKVRWQLSDLLRWDKARTSCSRTYKDTRRADVA